MKLNRKTRGIFSAFAIALACAIIFAFAYLPGTGEAFAQNPGPGAPKESRVASEARTAIVLNGAPRYSLAGRGEILEDKQGNLTLDQVRRSKKFIPTDRETPGFGFTDSVFWYRLRIRNPKSEGDRPGAELYLTLADPHINALGFFELDEQKVIRRLSTGSLAPFRKREIQHRHLVFRLNIPSGKERYIYLRAQNQEAVNFGLTLRSGAGFLRSNTNSLLVLGVYYGIILVMLLYNLILYISVQDRNYLFYILYIASFLVFQLIMNGFAFEYLWPNHEFWNSYSTKTVAGITGIFALAFTRNFLNVREYSRVLDYLLLFMIAAAFVLTVSPFVLSIRMAAIFSNLFGLAMVLTIVATAVYVLARGYRPARFFIIAWSALIVGIALLTLMFLGVLPSNPVTQHGMQLGSAVEMVLLSLGLRDRIRTMRRSREAAEKELVDTKLRMVDSFARFVPRQFLEFLKKESIEDVVPGDAVRQEITVLFNDLRNFTTISEGMTVEENFRFINEYLEHMEPVIQAHNGFIDKFIGDAIMALFPGSPRDALAAARDMRTALARFNGKGAEAGRAPVAMGIGLNRGPLMLGTVGTADRMDTTVIGDTVNLAARLEGLTRTYGTTIIASRDVADDSGDAGFHAREIDRVRVKGKNEPAVIHEIFDGDEPDVIQAKLSGREAFASGMENYRRGAFESALAHFQACDRSRDTVAELYIKRCEHYLANPPTQWSGITGRTLND